MNLTDNQRCSLEREISRHHHDLDYDVEITGEMMLGGLEIDFIEAIKPEEIPKFYPACYEVVYSWEDKNDKLHRGHLIFHANFLDDVVEDITFKE